MCYLTTGLDYLVIGNYLIKKIFFGKELIQSTLCPSIPAQFKLISENSTNKISEYRIRSNRWWIVPTFSLWDKYEISETIYQILLKADGKTPLSILLKDISIQSVQKELWDLWQRRLILVNK